MPFELKAQPIEPKKTNKATKLDIFMYKYSFLVLILLLGAVLAAGFFFLLKPKYEEVLLTFNKIYEQKKTEASTLKASERKALQYIVDFNSISESEKSLIDKIIPDSGQSELIYIEIEKIAKERGLILRKINITEKKEDLRNKNDEEKVKKGVNELEIDLIVEGFNYEGMKRFLSAIEKNIRLMDIQDITFSPDTFSANIKLLTYYSAL
jgi:Tfp pilus assembly protein PilO